jgi:hypothetical protein
MATLGPPTSQLGWHYVRNGGRERASAAASTATSPVALPTTTVSAPSSSSPTPTPTPEDDPDVVSAKQAREANYLAAFRGAVDARRLSWSVLPDSGHSTDEQMVGFGYEACAISDGVRRPWQWWAAVLATKLPGRPTR